jgi:hypothetical protein
MAGSRLGAACLIRATVRVNITHTERVVIIPSRDHDLVALDQDTISRVDRVIDRPFHAESRVTATYILFYCHFSRSLWLGTGSYIQALGPCVIVPTAAFVLYTELIRGIEARAPQSVLVLYHVD